MAKMKKRREADFTTKELAELSGCNSEQTFTNRLKAVCEHYNIDPNLFKLYGEQDKGENFFPVECGELIALLVRLYKDNPGAKNDINLKSVTTESICEFYKKIMDEIEELPEGIRNMVYVEPAYFTTQIVLMWLERSVSILTQYILSYIDEGEEDIGTMLKQLCISLDKQNYDRFFSYEMIRMIKLAKKEDQERSLQIVFGNNETIKSKFRKKLKATNVSIDVAIADLIKRLMVTISKDSMYSLNYNAENYASRDEYYEYLKEYTNPGDVKVKKYTVEKNMLGAKKWETIEEKIKKGNYMPDDIELNYEVELKNRKERIAKIKEILKNEEDELENFIKQKDIREKKERITEKRVREINNKYVIECESVRKTNNQLRDRTDKYISQVLWEFLNKNSN